MTKPKRKPDPKHWGRVTLTPAMVKRQRAREIARQEIALAERRDNALRWVNDHDADDAWRAYQVQDYLADGESGPLRLSHFEVARRDPNRLFYILEGGEDRDPGSGRFVKLSDSRLASPEPENDPAGPWMSDTRAEIMEHLPLINRLAKLQSSQVEPSSVLITGLGLGMAVRAALLHGAGSVDVFELDPDVLTLTGAQFASDSRVRVHQGDALTAPIPPPGRWDVAWHDIWPHINDLNLPEMEALKARYPARWAGAWQEDGCREMARLIALKTDYEALLGPIWDDEGFLEPALDHVMAEDKGLGGPWA
jgi:hypothetical protein